MHLSTLKLNQLRYGELDASAERTARTHLETCQVCTTRLQAQEANRAAFVLEPMPEALRSPEPANTRRWWAWVTPVLALAALLLLVPRLLPEPEVPVVPQEDQPTERAKGAGILLEAWVETTDGPLLLSENAVIAPGDIIQLKYDAQSFEYVSFGGVDGQGTAEVYGSYSTADGIQTAPFALNIDRTPGEQRFYALFTDQQPGDGLVKDAIAAQKAPEGGILRAIQLRKAR
jgi:hypothetical protein